MAHSHDKRDDPDNQKGAKAIARLRIHPAIGIARLGNSPDGFFIGPELPGDHAPPAGGYKDGSGRIKPGRELQPCPGCP